MKRVYDVEIKNIDGSLLDLHQYEGKKILIVNVASECGFTPQYAQLQELYDYYQESLVIIGVPCNDFGGQEPGSHNDIVAFCTKNYGVSFPLTEKVTILKNKHELFDFLENQAVNGVMSAEVKWNFHKFLIGEDGTLMAHFPSSIDPLDEELLSLIDV